MVRWLSLSVKEQYEAASCSLCPVLARFALLTICLSACGCRGERAPEPAPVAQEIAPDSWFVDRAAETGLAFAHVNGMSGQLYYAEIIPPGAALFDYDNDGDLDVYFVQSHRLDAGASASANGSSAAQGNGRLFRNDLSGSGPARTLRFTDVTAASRISATAYGIGVAAGDFTNDGCVDLYLTNLGPNTLLRNNCDGTFADVSRHSRTDDPSWSVSASFLDYDRDGWLDLFVGNYLNWQVASHAPCFGPTGRPDYCSPAAYQPQPSRLYRNNRDGTFTDATAAAGIARDYGPALGVSTADFNGDGWVDVYVANDGQPNQLWINQRNGTFANTGLLSGTALSAHGKAKAGMGVDAGDVDNDGDEDLFVVNLTGEGNDLYVNDGSGLFEEQSARSGLGAGSRAYTGFGTAWLDIDNDGRLDTLIVNGAVQTIDVQRRANDPLPLRQPKLLFRNLGDRRFEDVTAQGGAALAIPDVSRGAAFGDIDNDGDVDVLVAHNNGRPQLLVNGVGQRNHWIGLRLVGRQARRDMLGARVAIVREDGTTVWRRARADGSYASASDPRVIAGLGSSTAARTVRVIWPGGMTEEWSNVAVDRYTTLIEGSGATPGR
jgi:enediyne biosynthesis protein E4